MRSFYQTLFSLSIEKFFIFEELYHSVSDKIDSVFKDHWTETFHPIYEYIVTQKEKHVNRIFSRIERKNFTDSAIFY